MQHWCLRWYSLTFWDYFQQLIMHCVPNVCTPKSCWAVSLCVQSFFNNCRFSLFGVCFLFCFRCSRREIALYKSVRYYYYFYYSSESQICLHVLCSLHMSETSCWTTQPPIPTVATRKACQTCWRLSWLRCSRKLMRSGASLVSWPGPSSSHPPRILTWINNW